MLEHRLKLANIERAMELIEPVFLNTPQYSAEVLDPILGCRLVVKIETLNPIRSFKGRGASYFVSELKTDTTLVCASAGNFGQAMAYACRAKGVPLIVYASVNANPLKVERMRALGGEVRLAGRDFDSSKLEAKRCAMSSGMRMVEDSLEPATGEGAGTMGLELLRWKEEFDVMLIALGNGAMLTGIGRWVKAHSPRTQMIGVGSRGAPAMYESWRTGRVVEYPDVDTIADGIGVRLPIPEVVQDMQGVVDDVVLVSDASILKAMKLLHEHLGLVVEPSGAVGIAAILEDQERFRNKLIATIICGGNLTPEQIKHWLM
jgi:threonine dehydratase